MYQLTRNDNQEQSAGTAAPKEVASGGTEDGERI